MRKVHKVGFIVILLGILFFGGRHFVSSPQPTISPSPIASTSISPTIIPLGNGGCHARQVDPNNRLFTLPDPSCTPGVTNPNVTQDNIQSTICVPGFTKTIRPPASDTDRLKQQSMIDYGFTDSITEHEEDHLIPLEIGGNPIDLRNLWAEPGKATNPKDHLENTLHKMVCAGQITLQDAQNQITTDWVSAYHKYVGP